MNIETKWNVGQFLTTLTATVDEATVEALLPLALRYLGQRNTEIDRILGGFEVGPDGKSKRRADYKRNEVEYSDELAQALAKSFSTLEFPDSTKEKPHTLAVEVAIERYEGGGSEPKYAAEKRAVAEYLVANEGKLKDGSARTVASFCANRGIEAPTDADKWKEDETFLKNVKAWMKSVATQE